MTMLLPVALSQVMSTKQFFWATLRFMFTATLVAVAIWWCIQIAARFRDDAHALIERGPWPRKAVVVAIGVVTLWILLWLVRLFYGIIVSSWWAWQ